MRDDYCSIVAAEPIETTFPTDHQLHIRRRGPSHHRPIIPFYSSSNADGHDQVMENLQKLFDTHQQRRTVAISPLGLLDQQAGCSTSSRADLMEDLMDAPSTSSGGTTNSNPKLNIPLLLASDARSTILKTTMVSGQILACFVIGGECRLCFPQMRALCLGEIQTQKIDETMKALAIINPHASEEQLNVLKKGHIVPAYLPKCELITKTNAERLMALLKSSGATCPPEFQNEALRQRFHPLKVAHDCFGGCAGLLYPTIVHNPCLECRTCHFMFRPEDFCRHTHQPVVDKNTCFWGFDASNWPYYIRIDDEDGGGGIVNGFAQNGQDAETQLANFIQNYTSSSNYPTTQTTMG